ncbi:sulfite exporter TauE/SafE family protein [Abyssalbus ytuae]|uniref:Sulfite exporter TauE/SafE family protein n=1 Tax=Abyssalbus ytuae TaxID=2926907 RepID=A0A9E6ZN17_9FLAO|nr:sulfite exporter TauE/SafE family protein [Abyssalbus ytuae]UOB18914.1 sulfite exporter TauE/SafE family protein [Abyssalbus ytuae]
MLSSAIILGFLGSFHCVGMCGPIAFVLPLDRKNPVKKFFQILLYHTGRLITYGLLGFLFGIIGKGLFISGLQQRLSIVIGVIMIIAAVIPYGKFQKYNFSKPAFKILAQIKSSLGTQLRKKNFTALFSIGFLNGFLPCGLVYMALFGAIAMGSPERSFLYMLLFGIGTIPLMSGAAYLGNFLSGTARKRVQQLIPVFVVIIGIFFILRGMGLGIPYISPSEIHLMVKSNPDCVTP